MKSVSSSFVSRGLRCAGTLLLPDRGDPPPVIVMAHGFAGVRAMLLPHATRFVEAGYAVFLFDYRNFGDSEGKPRHWVDPGRHLGDWDAPFTTFGRWRASTPGAWCSGARPSRAAHVVCMAARGASGRRSHGRASSHERLGCDQIASRAWLSCV